MGQPARNHGGTLGHGYRGNPRGRPDKEMFKAAIKSPESVGVGVEVVTRQEFERRKNSIEDSGAFAAVGGLSDSKGIRLTI